MALTVAVLESLFTANVKDFEKKADQVDKTQKALDKSDPTVKVKAETTGALGDMLKVETSAKKITDTKVVSQVDADISKAQASATKIETNLKVLAALPVDVQVTADIAKAQASLEKVETRLAGLRGARAEMVVVADTKKAEAALDDVADKAGSAGTQGGKDAGEGLSAGILAAIVALPVAGAVVAAGVAIGKSLMDGMQVEVRSDALMAKTGLDAKSIAPIARAAGEAYANNWGESIASNMDTARAAIQSGLLDVDGTEKDSQRVIESLAGVADILGEDIPRIARSTAQLLRTGLAKDAESAFDLIVKGTQAGLNVSEDMLDTIDEYGTQFRKLGLEGPEAFGLLAQAVRGGARDTDTAADALKEFSIKATDMSKTSVAAFDFLGISSTKMADVFTTGGPKAAAALDMVLDKVRNIKDPSDQAAIAVALFGTKAEDMGSALFKMDLSTAVRELGSVEGAAQSAMDTLGDNTAGVLASAQRNIEVAADGIKGALATAFAPQIQGFSTFVTENREAVMQFLLDMANGGIDAGRALANGAANATDAFGNMVGSVGPTVLGLIESILSGLDKIPGIDIDMPGFRKMKDDAEASFAAFDKGSSEAADAIRKNLIENGLDPVQEKLNAVAIPLIAQAALHDASVVLAKDIDAIGYAADGSKLKLDTHKGSIDTTTTAGKILSDQIHAMVESLDAEAVAAVAAGEDQATLNTRYGEGRQALVDQLVQMGFTAKQAEVLADKYRAVPGTIKTQATLDKEKASADLKALTAQIAALPDGVVNISTVGYASSYMYLRNMQVAIDKINGSRVRIAMGPGGSGGTTFAAGGHVTAAASGMDRQSMIAPGGSNILWAEPETLWETYISGKPSQRARNINLLTETARRFGLTVLPAGTKQYASGSAAGTAPAQSVAGGVVVIDYDRLAEAMSHVQLASSVVLDSHVVGTSIATWSQKRVKDSGKSGLAL